MMQLYWVALKSIWTKEIHRFMRIWIQTLVPPVITMTLYFVIFGNLIGSRIGEMHGFTYMQFIVPGLIMMAVITNAYANVASSFFSAKFVATESQPTEPRVLRINRSSSTPFKPVSLSFST